eukprot:TRINITY_DN4402_c0_g1_i2.p1 TRINITY_DN4402_c0_g1~~TRINITY_DN4402_c0_g1_i2.p1  ORF type:complete len:113 (+),score=25.90 TRINITY_DN4402_c0_g1_i2:53-391(+)
MLLELDYNFDDTIKIGVKRKYFEFYLIKENTIHFLDFMNERDMFIKFEHRSDIEVMDNYHRMKLKKKVAQEIFDTYLLETGNHRIEIPSRIIKKIDNQLKKDPQLSGIKKFN